MPRPIWEAAAASTAPPPALVEAENRQVRFLAARISEALDEAGALEAETAALLEGDETYACLLTVPGIGPAGPRRSSRCRSTSGGSRTTTTWPRTAA